MNEPPGFEEDSGNGGNAGPVYEEEDSGNGGNAGPVYEDEDSGNGGNAGPVYEAEDSGAPASITREGDKTVIRITTGGDLYNLASMLNNGIFEQTVGADISDVKVTLTQNIDLRDFQSDDGFLPIGTIEYPFTGEFDGGGYTVSNISINRETELFQGLFGVIGNGGNVRDLTLTGAKITGRAFVGGIAGLVDFGEISNCYVDGDIMADIYVAGGIAGVVEGSVIDNCQTSGTVTADSESAGGIAGTVMLDNSVVRNCASSSLITVTFSAGGIVGSLMGGNVEGCRFSGVIECNSDLFGNITGEIGTVESDEAAVDMIFATLAVDDEYWQLDTQSDSNNANAEPAGDMEVSANE